jgi:3-oxoacyl-[acyl-carrier-protein] synthase III
MNRRTIITGIGHYLPPRVVTNFDLEKRMNTSDEWIRQRSGIVERRHVEPGVGSSDLAIEAARLAMADAGAGPGDIDFVIAATLSPDHYFPGNGVIVQAKLGLGTVGALDVRDQCCGFLYGLAVADQFIRAGTYRKILFVASEVQSSNLDYSDDGRDLAVLFGDGAGAVVLEPDAGGTGRGILSTHLFSDGRFMSDLWMEKPSSRDNPSFQEAFLTGKKFYPHMEGKNVFKNACQRMPEAVMAALSHNGLAVADIDILIPHQANDRISQMVARGLKIPEAKVLRNIDRYGNTTSASIPIALSEAVRGGIVRPGHLVVLTAFGSGYTWASAAIRW